MNGLSYNKKKNETGRPPRGVAVSVASSSRNENWAHQTASVFKILADSTRCKILKVLVQNPDGMCVGDIADAIGATHSATSHQLNNLEDRGVLVSIRDGQTVCYELADTRLARNIESILKVFFA